KKKKKRVEIYRKMDSLVMEHVPVIPLYYDEVVRFVKKDVKGLKTNPMNLLELRRVKIKDTE
ncbi:MAG: ABC transporter substrate-binding protein, partial [Flavobacteriales bacterium]